MFYLFYLFLFMYRQTQSTDKGMRAAGIDIDIRPEEDILNV